MQLCQLVWLGDLVRVRHVLFIQSKERRLVKDRE
jgi:hypothetical protein